MEIPSNAKFNWTEEIVECYTGDYPKYYFWHGEFRFEVINRRGLYHIYVYHIFLGSLSSMFLPMLLGYNIQRTPVDQFSKIEEGISRFIEDYDNAKAASSATLFEEAIKEFNE